MALNQKKIEKELRFRTSRSSGAGGQHVNTTETKVELLFNVRDTKLLTHDEKEQIGKRLRTRINEDGVISVSSSQHRSQAGNKDHALKKFFALLEKGLKKEKKRIATTLPESVKNEILNKKKKRSVLKADRGKRTRDFL